MKAFCGYSAVLIILFMACSVPSSQAILGGAEVDQPKPLAGFENIRAVLEIDRDTRLVSDGRVPALLAPKDVKYKLVTETLRAALAKRLDVQVELADGLEAAKPGARTIIAIGNMLTNPLITRLYFNGYSYEDSLCPADKAYVLRVAYDPYPWRGKKNIIILGCETPTGAERAVRDFLSRLEEEGDKTFLPYTLVVSEDAKPYTTIGSARNYFEPITELPAAGPTGSAHVMPPYAACADAYLRTGKEEAARRAVASLEAWIKWYKANETNPDTNLGATAYVKEFEFFNAVLPFEYCPLMTDDLRLDMARIVLRCADDMWDYGKGYPFGKGVGPTWNHNTEPLMGAYLAGRYLLHYYAINRCKGYVDAARECFTWQNKSWRSAEDSGSYLTYSSLSGMRWALMEWDLTFFESGLARKHADFIITACDQYGQPGGFGDGGANYPRIPYEALPLVFWYTRDADLLWYLNQYNQIEKKQDWPNPFWRDVTPKRDERFMGVRAAMMDPPLYARTLKIPLYGEKALSTTTVPVAEAVDKIAFREGWDKTSQFLMLDGFGRGHHLHYDIQAITALHSDGVEKWLLDRDYLERDSSRHAMLTLLHNGRCNMYAPAFSRLDALGDYKVWGMSRTTVPDYNHAHWSRSIVWRKGKYFLVFDEVEAAEPGDFVFDIGYRLGSSPQDRQRMTGARTFLAERDIPKTEVDTTKRFVIQSADDVGMYAHNEWVDRLRRNRMYVRQRRTAKLQKGEARSFASLLVPTAPKRRGAYALKRIGPRAFVVTGDEPALVAFGKFKNGDVSIDAACAMISAAEVAGTDVHTLRVGGISLPNGDVSVTLDGAPDSQRAVKAALDRLTALSEKSEDEPGEGFRPAGFPLAGKPTPPAWQAEFPAGEAAVARLRVADLDADGAPEILVARGALLYCLTTKGTGKWKFEDKRKINDISIGRFRPGKELQILVGGDGEHVYILDAAGNPLNKVRYNEDRSVVKNFINTVTAADINGDGIDEALAGGRDWHFHLYDANLKELFRQGESHHGVTAIRCADVDGDGRKEVFVANRYGSVNGYRISKDMKAPEYMFHRYLSIGDVGCDVADIDGDGRGEVVLGCSTGDLVAAKADKNFDEMLFRFDNFGYDVMKILVEDMNGDGAGEVLVGSRTGYVYVLDGRARGEGRPLLAHRVGRAVMDIATVEETNGRRAVLASDVSGRVVVVSMSGEDLFAVQAPSSVTHVAILPREPGKYTVVAATADGQVLAYDR